MITKILDLVMNNLKHYKLNEIIDIFNCCKNQELKSRVYHNQNSKFDIFNDDYTQGNDKTTATNIFRKTSKKSIDYQWIILLDIHNVLTSNNRIHIFFHQLAQLLPHFLFFIFQGFWGFGVLGNGLARKVIEGVSTCL
jgi:hypothetical protein